MTKKDDCSTAQIDLEDAIAMVSIPFEQSVQSRYLDEYGREMPNPVPMQPPVGFKKQPTIAEQMRAMIKQASYEAAQAGAETEEEANDFDVAEDYDPTSPWEHEFEPDPVLEVMLARQSAKPKNPASNPPSSTPANPPAQPVSGAQNNGAPDSNRGPNSTTQTS